MKFRVSVCSLSLFLMLNIAVAAEEKIDDDPVATIESFFTAISGGIGEKRDLKHILSHFHDDARYWFAQDQGEDMSAVTVKSRESLKDALEPWEERGFFERIISAESNIYGRLAHVLVAYEITGPNRPEPVRGLDSVQMFHDGEKWLILSMYWQSQWEGLPRPETVIER